MRSSSKLRRKHTICANSCVFEVMFELSQDEISRTMSHLGGDVLLVASPNYEPRSVRGVAQFIEMYDDALVDCEFAFLTLQARHGRVEPLEDLKSSAIRYLGTLISEKYGKSHRSETIPYPDNFRNAVVRSTLDILTAQLNMPFNLIVDLTSLPRKVLLALLGTLSTYAQRGLLKHLLFLYSWPESYPRLRYASDTGRLNLAELESPVSAAIDESICVNAALSLGLQGFEAIQFSELLPNNSNLSLFILMQNDDPLTSLEVIRANVSIVTQLSTEREYCLSLNSMHEKLNDWARKVEIDDRSIYLLAPFGPKPQMVSAWMARRIIEQRITTTIPLGSDISDIVLYSGHQYNTTYSLGFRKLSVFKVNISDLVEVT